MPRERFCHVRGALGPAFSLRSRVRASLALCLLLACVCVCACGGGFSREALPAPASPGARLWTARCGACHARPHPARYSFADWQPVLRRMDLRIRKAGRPPLTAAEAATIAAYIKEHAL